MVHWPPCCGVEVLCCRQGGRGGAAMTRLTKPIHREQGEKKRLRKLRRMGGAV